MLVGGTGYRSGKWIEFIGNANQAHQPCSNRNARIIRIGLQHDPLPGHVRIREVFERKIGGVMTG